MPPQVRVLCLPPSALTRRRGVCVEVLGLEGWQSGDCARPESGRREQRPGVRVPLPPLRGGLAERRLQRS